MSDPTEPVRRIMTEVINSSDVEGVAKATDEPTWTTAELTRDFDVLGFLAPFVVVRRKSDGVKGSLMFKHSPRIYFGWTEDK